MKISKKIINQINEDVQTDVEVDYQIEFLINDEQEAIRGYENALVKLQEVLSEDKFNKAKEVMDHIISEEREHIEELKKLNRELDYEPGTITIRYR